MTRQRLCRALVVLGSLAAIWAVAVLWTGGVVFRVGEIRVSARSARNSALLALLSALTAWVVGPSGRRGQTLAAECRRITHIATRRLGDLPAIPRPGQSIAAIAAVGAVIAGLTQGAPVAGASDSYGYVSQAHLWATGTLRKEPPLMRQLTPALSLDVLSPLGYRPSVDGTTIAPTYSPGLPIVMAAFERMAGPKSVFWVVPILGGVLVWATYLLGRRVGGPAVGALAALLAATSPPFLFQLTNAPLSDLPAAAWWVLAMALIPSRGRVSAFGAGAAAGLAILTRPNLVPLLAILSGVLIWRFGAERRARWLTFQQTMLFAFGPIAAVLTAARVNTVLWGSPLTSGYGSLSALYDAANIWPNLMGYPRVIAAQMPVALLALVAPIALQRQDRGNGDTRHDRTMVGALWCFVVIVVMGYLAYPAYDSSWNLRFLLPAFPPLLVLASVAAFSLAGHLMQTHKLVCVAVVAAVTGYGVDYARDQGTFDTDHLRRYAVIGEYVAQRLPERAVLLAMLHSGSVTYYSGRPTLRYDLLSPARLDWLVEELEQRAYSPYILLDAEERMIFQARFRGQSRLSALDWPPAATLRSGDVQIFSLSKDRDSATGRPPVTEVVPWPFR